MLDEHLLQERLNQFNPEPLVEIDDTKTKENIELYVIVEDENNVDLTKTNFLDVLNSDEIKKSSENIIRKYGVGTCGPRAFYGTTDIHLELEERIAEFLGMEEAIVYSYGFVAISSSIAAYCKGRDIIFIDREANFPIQQVEGVSWKTGKVLPLEEFLKVAEDFKMRVFLEETYSIGIFGDHGRGLTEHFNIDPNRLDMIIGTLESAIGSIGGFCAGSKMTIEHQRLSGSGYIFSASLPTYLVQACLESIKVMGEKPKKLRALAREFHVFLKETCKFDVISDPEVAFKVFTVSNEENRREKEEEIHKFCKENGIHFRINETGLLINLNVALYDNKPRLEKVYNVLKQASEL
ncbi:hypothetical protein NQ314_000327 [Rhamnusium bicolor]|uniref:Serine palmitoyltransferase 1 n=1 Tax=Rhamnusium bicolor TaxID=1586634 RepID=A0AAV8ZUY1_9CUCU|nr:hypothetical protein NQ314_000327 [Rhamnusium bicolor]